MKKTLKRIIAVMLCAVMMLSFAACASEKAPSGDDEPGDSTVYKIGICQLVTHDALDAATQGFKDYLTEKLGEDGVEFDLQNAAGDSPTCSTIVNQFVSDDVDLIMANATPALQAAMQATEEIPIVATSITDFATALQIDDWKGVSGFNVTGSSDLAPLDQQAEMVTALVPEAKTVGILYCSGEPNSVYQATVVKEALEAKNVTVKEYTIADTTEITTVVTAACDEVDAIYIPTDNIIASATEAVNEIAAPKNIPVIAGEEGICKGCGVATLSIDYYDIGQKAGEMAYDILVNGKDPAQMEIVSADATTKKYVADRATALNITIPEDYVAIDMTAE